MFVQRIFFEFNHFASIYKNNAPNNAGAFMGFLAVFSVFRLSFFTNSPEKSWFWRFLACFYNMSYVRYYSFWAIPSFAKIFSIKHHLVNADWNKLRPTKAVKRYQYWFTKNPSDNEIITNIPAIALMYWFIVITISPVCHDYDWNNALLPKISLIFSVS